MLTPTKVSINDLYYLVDLIEDQEIDFEPRELFPRPKKYDTRLQMGKHTCSRPNCSLCLTKYKYIL